MAMEYVTQRFENSSAGIAQKDAFSKQMAAQGYRIHSEQVEQGHSKGGEQCCLFAICMPCVFLAGRTPGAIVVTYSRDMQACPNCGYAVLAGNRCEYCLRVAGDRAQQAISQTAKAQERIKQLETLLADSTAIDYRLNWESLRRQFLTAVPQLEPESPPRSVPAMVRLVQAAPWLENIATPLLDRRLKWDEEIEADTLKRADVVEKHAQALENWKHSKESFENIQKTQIEEKQFQYLKRERDALINYWTLVLGKQIYGAKSSPVSLRFNDAQNRLLVDYELPSIDMIPKIDEVRYLQRENILHEVSISDELRETLYRDLLVKVALITIYMLFQSDAADALTTVAFNGTINTIDRATGREIKPCVIAVEALKSTFMGMNLSQVDTGACFTGLNGRISEHLRELAPVDAFVN